MSRQLATRLVTLTTLVLLTQTFVAFGWLRPVKVFGDSMSPGLSPGQQILIDRGASVRRWDVVVVRSPEDARRMLVKRVIGLPGERLALPGGEVWADGRSVGNPPDGPVVYYGAVGNPVWELGDEEWFVAGDNQMASVDSRHWGPVPERLLEGVVTFATKPPRRN